MVLLVKAVLAVLLLYLAQQQGQLLLAVLVAHQLMVQVVPLM